MYPGCGVDAAGIRPSCNPRSESQSLRHGLKYAVCHGAMPLSAEGTSFGAVVGSVRPTQANHAAERLRYDAGAPASCEPYLRECQKLSFVILTAREREELSDTFFRLRAISRGNPIAFAEAQTALRCLKAVHSNAIEDKRVDRIFLQVMLHGAGIQDKGAISRHYGNAHTELRGQEKMLRVMEANAAERTPLSISLVLEMHRHIFQESMPDNAGRFRTGEVRIKGMEHRPCHHSKITQILHQHLQSINARLFEIGSIDSTNFSDVLRLSAEAHYLVACVHPFEDGNGRVARAIGDYVMLVPGYFYDVIMMDYRDIYLDAISECTLSDTTPLFKFLEFSYLETLKRISGFFEILD